ncbi:GNAT family N-acetyltransferase [Paractinoplanes rishiriensis]|uniref:N-acetyltransferase domain-containing protein n=1 Tax=Paractinoplanes rishiriensis TaxID=1050105 RepID=A0A919K8B7_9ACTN|nr:GNAT family N-acetyltransferase [Actinoplanes rishiriensis]GIF01565.1 hypothetical protein Ari01nite_90290 [Actinoplanes rishiriensis]
MTERDLRTGWPGPDGHRIQLAGPGDATAAGRLLTLAEHGLDQEAEMLARDPRLALGLQRGLSGGPDSLLRETVEALSISGTLREPCVGLSTVLVVAPRGGPPKGALMAFPPVRVLHGALDAGVGVLQVMSAALAVVKLKGVAVASEARGIGLGAALIRRCAQLYEQLGWHVLYGQFNQDSGLDGYYSRLGFDVLGAGEPLHLAGLLGFPLSIHPMPGERLFVRWR